jgi:hypothetical protein
MGRQNEGIKDIDPVRHGRVAAKRFVDPISHNMENTRIVCLSYTRYSINMN